MRTVRKLRIPLWMGEDLTGRTLWVYAEQGFGDTLQFLRFLPLAAARGARIIFDCQPELLRLLREFPGIAELRAEGGRIPAADFQVPLMSLPYRLGITLENLPPARSLAPKREEGPVLKRPPGTRLAIGIVWAGRPQLRSDKARSMTLDLLLNGLRDVPGLALYSLQKRAAQRRPCRPRRTNSGSRPGHPRFRRHRACSGATRSGDHRGFRRSASGRGAGPTRPSPHSIRAGLALDGSGLAISLVSWPASLPPAIAWRLAWCHRESSQNPGSMNNSPYQLTQTRNGLMLDNPNDTYMGRALLEYGECCELESQFLLSLPSLRPGQVIEVGANIGIHSVPLAKALSAEGRRMVVFEPQPFVFQNLCANLALNGLTNVTAWPWACGAKNETVWFDGPDYKSPGNFGGVSVGPEAKPGHVAVPCVRLDDVLEPYVIGLLKIDVEGYELQVLQGAVETLSRSRPLLYVENDRIDKSQALIEWLWQRDYRLFWHVPRLFNPDNFLKTTLMSTATFPPVTCSASRASRRFP